VAGDLSTLAKDNKARLPKAVLTDLKWSLADGPISLIAELVELGRVRLHLAADVQPRIDLLLVETAKGDDADERTSVIRDRFRPVQMYTTNSDFRVRLTPVVVAYLDLPPTYPRELYVDGRLTVVDIMSLRYRNERLERYVATTTI
jgi:hypothetical protein